MLAALLLATCADLSTLKLPHTSIVLAQTVPPGTFQLPADSPRADPSYFTAFASLPTFCRVRGLITPSADSHIEFEVWLPPSGWNGRYIGAGNGGTSGSINYDRLGEAVRDGSVGSATDVGHKDADARWFEGHPQKVIDFDHRAIHETAERAKAIVAAFYGRPAAHSYFVSCSNGGRQGLVEAQRYPADYDGIVAGAPAYSFGTKLGAKTLNWWKPDFRAFQDRGGRLIIYHGGNDHPDASVDFYRRLPSARQFARLYVVPGMGHCGGGPTDIGERLQPGQDAAHSVVRALQRWVESGVAPQDISGIAPYR